MELVYLWVEDYKNIQKQGFNFSPRFECSYDEKNNTLDIKPKEHLENFFGENINVTAIVGENGSGKSSIFEILTFLYWRSFINHDKDKTFFLFYSHNNFYIQCENYKTLPITKKDLNTFIKFNNYSRIQNPEFFCARGQMPLITFSNSISDITNNQRLKNLKEYSNYYNGIQPSSPMIKSKNTYDNFNQKFHFLMHKETSFFNFINENFIFDSYQLELHFSELEAIVVQYHNEELQRLLSFQKVKNNSKKELLYRLIGIIALEETSSILLNQFLEKNDHAVPSEDIDLYIKNLLEDDIVNLLQGSIFNETTFNKIINICNTSLSTINNTLDQDTFNIEVVKSIMKTYNMGDMLQDKSQSILKSQIFLIENDNMETIHSNKLLKVLLKYKILRFNFMNSKDINYNFFNLSSGEKLYLNVLTNYSYTLFNLEDNYKGIILFDEIELSFHPNWQKQLIKHFIHIQQKISHSKILNLHLLLTSHSPFILSDLPKENVIFLDRYKKKDIEVINGNQEIGNCKNVSRDININPFGANIHTLLSHGFFMKNGLMGEFAKNKINKILYFLNGKNSYIDFPVEQIKLIIEKIGEDFLKEKLTLMYYKKFPKFKDEQIKKLQKQIDELKR